MCFYTNKFFHPSKPKCGKTYINVNKTRKFSVKLKLRLKMILFKLALIICSFRLVASTSTYCRRNENVFQTIHRTALQNKADLFLLVSIDQTNLGSFNSSPKRFYNSSQPKFPIILFGSKSSQNDVQYQLDIRLSGSKGGSSETVTASNIQLNAFAPPNALACTSKGEHLKVYVFETLEQVLDAYVVIFGACRLHERSGQFYIDKTLTVLTNNAGQVNTSEVEKMIKSKINNLLLTNFQTGLDFKHQGFCMCCEVNFYLQECIQLNESNNGMLILFVAISLLILSWIIQSCRSFLNYEDKIPFAL